MKAQAQTIYTLDARNNVMLEVMRDNFDLDARTMHREIKGLHHEMIAVLAKKKIEYAKLKSALVPATDRHEAGFIFDSQRIKSSWYGHEVARLLLPHLDPRTTQSFLCGDLLGRNQDIIFEVLNKHMVLARSFEFVHGTLLYCVYLNNLSETSLARLHTKLTDSPAYLGFIPATYQTFAKTYLSTTLAHTFVKHERIVLMGHEDDRPDTDNVNLVGYDFKAFGYQVRSVRSTHFDLFLAFKVERAVHKGFEVDTEMSLNSVSTNIVPLQDCDVVLDEAKFLYLQSAKGGKLDKAGLANTTRASLAELIRKKVMDSYIYNLAFLQEHDVVKFNVIIEVPRDNGYPTRFTAALQYQPDEKLLRVITLT